MHDLVQRVLTHRAPSSTSETKKHRITDRRPQESRPCNDSGRLSIRKAMKGLVGGAAAGSAENSNVWTAAFIPRSLGRSTHPTEAEQAAAARAALGGGQYRQGRKPRRRKYGAPELVKRFLLNAQRFRRRRRRRMDPLCNSSRGYTTHRCPTD